MKATRRKKLVDPQTVLVKNPRAAVGPFKTAADFAKIELDLAFVESLGLPDEAWAQIFGMPNFLSGTREKMDIMAYPSTMACAYRAAEGFGFKEPWQFFTERSKAP